MRDRARSSKRLRGTKTVNSREWLQGVGRASLAKCDLSCSSFEMTEVMLCCSDFDCSLR